MSVNEHVCTSFKYLTFLNEVPSLTSGTEGKFLRGFISREPALRLYRLLMTTSRSDVVFTGRNRRRGTLIPDRRQIRRRNLSIKIYPRCTYFNMHALLTTVYTTSGIEKENWSQVQESTFHTKALFAECDISYFRG